LIPKNPPNRNIRALSEGYFEISISKNDKDLDLEDDA